MPILFLKENLTFTGDDFPMLFLSVMGRFTEFERSFIRERKLLEGIALAKKKGRFKGHKLKLVSGF